MSLHDSDFYAWTQQQSKLLKERNLEAIDIDHLIEEVESMGNTERKSLESAFRILLAHLLKWKFQPRLRGKSWRLTIKEQRMVVNDLLDSNPSLKHPLPEIIGKGYCYAVLLAEKETDIESHVFAKECPWDFWEFMDPEFWPQ